MPDRRPDRAAIHETCAVAFRARGETHEFCLVVIPGDSRWEFPHAPLRAGEEPSAAALRVLGEQAGWDARLFDPVPVGEFRYLCGSERRVVTAFLLQCDDDRLAAAARAPTESRRPQWFLPEEARARLRRKPMRLLATTAQRRLCGTP